MPEKIHDRRRHFRFNAETGSLRLLHFRSNEKLGGLLNISYGGLAYRYAPNAEQPNNGFRFDMFRVANTALLLNGVTTEIVYDLDASEVFQVDSGRYRIRGIKFSALRRGQKHQIEHCIKKHTLIKDYVH